MVFWYVRPLFASNEILSVPVEQLVDVVAQVSIANETVEKPDCSLVGIPDGVDVGGIL